MYQCKCGRKFKTPQALGGHRGTCRLGQEGAEPQAPSEAPAVAQAVDAQAPPDGNKPQVASPSEAAQAVTDKASPDGDEECEAKQIRQYLAQGYSFEQLTGPLKFKPTTVRREMAKDNPPEEPEGHEDQETPYPMTRKYGQGMEVLNPEVIIGRIMNNGQVPLPYGLGLRDGMLLLRAGMLMTMDLVNIQKGAAEAQAKALEPVLKVLQEGRAEMDSAARRAKESTVEVAHTAAQETLGGAMPQILEMVKQQAMTQSANPFAGMMAGVMQPILQQTLGNLMGSLMAGAVLAKAGRQQGQAGQPAEQVEGTVAGFEVMSEKEREEAFGDGAIAES